VKCIRCNTDNNLKDRTANLGRCSSCNHQFVFEPTAMPQDTKLTDPFFAKVITDLSANNTLFFTPRQFYYLLDKRLRSRLSKTDIMTNPVGGIGCGIFFVVFLAIFIHGMFGLPFEFIIPILINLVFVIGIWSIAASAVSPYLNRRIRQRSILPLSIMAALITLFGFSIRTPILKVASLSLGLGTTWLSRDLQRKQRKIFDKFLVEQPQFDEWLHKWNSINDSPEKILAPPQTASLPAAPNPEVTAYSFDRVVVCDSPKIAQLLISNNFHFENNCAILSIDQYPQSIFSTTMAMLRRNPDLKVYALHDCSPEGLQLIHRLRAEEIWFPDSAIPIIDVGILPRQIMYNLDVMTPQSTESAQLSQRLDAPIRNNLMPEELVWLDAGCYLELEFFSPQKLIQILQRAINESRELATIEGGDLLMMNTSFYTVEGFG
jgi:hypothetical protein